MNHLLRIPSYWNPEQERYEDAPVFEYPNEKELLKMLADEAKVIIPMKIKEWEASDSPDSEKHIKRLKRLSALMDVSKSGKFQDWDNAFARAKEVPIQELFEFERLRMTAKGYECRCPFHKDKSPSFLIYRDNHFRCFSCGRFGDSIDFIKELRGVSVKHAVALLGGAYGK